MEEKQFKEIIKFAIDKEIKALISIRVPVKLLNTPVQKNSFRT
jgi:hypothetical protein